MMLMLVAAGLVLNQAAFAQKNLGPAIRRLANSQAERSALSNMFKASKTLEESVKKASSVELEPIALSASRKADLKRFSSKAAAFSALSKEGFKNIYVAVEDARKAAASAYQVDTRVFLTKPFRAHFSNEKANPVVFMNIGAESSLGALELFDKLGNIMINRRMYVQTEEGGLVALFKDFQSAAGKDAMFEQLACSGKFKYVAAVNLRNNTLQSFLPNGTSSVRNLDENGLKELSQMLGADKQILAARQGVSRLYRLEGIGQLRQTVLQVDPSAAMVVITADGAQELAAQVGPGQKVLVAVTTPFDQQQQINSLWNRFSAQNLSWEQNVFFQNGAYGDDLLLQTAVEPLRHILKYDYRLIVHTAK